jgi:multiple sugar transport system permease protein
MSGIIERTGRGTRTGARRPEEPPGQRSPLATVGFLLPAMVPLTVFWIVPMVLVLWWSFTNWDMMAPEYDIVGLENYELLISRGTLGQVLWNTAYFTIGTVVPTVAGGLLLALLLHKRLRGSSLYRTIIFSPWVTPMVAMSIVFTWIFEPRVGLANHVMTSAGLPALPWASSSDWAMVVIIIVTVWRQLGWAMIFYTVALGRVPADLYEAAEMDGSSSWAKFKDITLPMISPTTFFLVIVMTIEALQAFDQIDVITQGGPAGSTRTLLYFYYQAAFERFQVGEAAAVAVFLVLLTGIIALAQFVVGRRFVHYQ